MKYYITFLLIIFAVTGCSKKLPRECIDYFKKIDKVSAFAKKKGAPEYAINMYNLARDKMHDELSKLDKENQIRICSIANAALK